MLFNLEIIVAAFAFITGVIAMPEPAAAFGDALNPRSCVPAQCKADPSTTISGTYCGYCELVLSTAGGVSPLNGGDIFQLNAKTGECCSFGPSKACTAGAVKGEDGDQSLCHSITSE